MKKLPVLLASAILALSGLITSVPALAHGTQWNVGVIIGVPLGYPHVYYVPPPYYPPYYYSQPQVVAVPVYVERAPQSEPVPPNQTSSAEWSYCPASKAYYPYVRECPAGWQKVPPQPSR